MLQLFPISVINVTWKQETMKGEIGDVRCLIKVWTKKALCLKLGTESQLKISAAYCTEDRLTSKHISHKGFSVLAT